MNYLQKLQTTNNTLSGDVPEADEVFFKILHHVKDDDGYINFSSASDMHVAGKVWSPEVQTRFAAFNLQKITKYPGLVTTTKFLEKEAMAFFARAGITVSDGEVLVTNGSLSSPSIIMVGSPFPCIVHPDKSYSSQLAAFRAAGRRLLSCRTDLDGRVDTMQLRELVKEHRNEIAFIYINHNEGAAPTRPYLDELYAIASEYDTYILYDADILRTHHKPSVNPSLPLERRYRDRFVVLTSFSKEFNAPAMRLGLAIGPQPLLYQIKLFQKHKLEMMPAPSLALAAILLEEVDISMSASIFQRRMLRITGGLQQLGWPIEPPEMGINLFVSVPPSFRPQGAVSAGTLFAFHLMRCCRVMVRPGILHGDRLKNTVRFVVSPYDHEIQDVLDRFKKAGIYYDMPLPNGLEQTFAEAAAKV